MCKPILVLQHITVCLGECTVFFTHTCEISKLIFKLIIKRPK